MTDSTESVQLLVNESRRIAEAEFEESAFTWDGEMPWENIELLADKGFVGVNFPEEYGGGGLSEYAAARQIQAIGEICPDTMNLLREMSLIAPRALEMFGSDVVKEHYLPRVTAGETHLAICISEPHAGSDVRAMNTTMEQTSDGEWYISGEKVWVSHVPDCAAGVVWTKFPDESLGAVVVDFDAEGFEIIENYTNMVNHTQTHFSLDDVNVPAENILVRGREGFKNVLRSLNWERCSVAIGLTSMASNAFQHALEYAKEREAFGQSISEFQGIQWKFADMAKYLEASRLLNNRAIQNANKNNTTPDRLETSIANLFASDVADYVVDESLQIHGAAGYMKGHPLEYLYRHVRGRRIGGGTDEIQKNQIASAVLESGLPTEDTEGIA